VKQCETKRDQGRSDGESKVGIGDAHLARRGCSKCSNAAHLALVAPNAVRNGDLYRALEVLDEIAGTDVEVGSKVIR